MKQASRPARSFYPLKSTLLSQLWQIPQIAYFYFCIGIFGILGSLSTNPEAAGPKTSLQPEHDKTRVPL
jgi:hypothetical protein